MKSKGAYRLDPSNSGFSNVDLSIYTHRPFMIVPYANSRYEYPPLSELEYIDEFGYTGYGHVVSVGTVCELRESLHAPIRSSYNHIACDIWASCMNDNKIFITLSE